MLKKAIRSISIQTLKADKVIVETDYDHLGAAITKNRGISRVDTEWTALLDDDDQFLPSHLAKLHAAAIAYSADVVYSVPLIPQNPNFVNGEPQYYKPFSAEVLQRRSYIQTTSLMRTSLLKEAGGFQCPQGSNYDDWGCMLAMHGLGAKFHHVPEQTFIWNHHGYGTPGHPGNTSGRGDRW